MKNRRLAILLIALLPILAGCVRLEGNIAIDGSGLVNGKITYSLDKSLASQGGINSLQDLQNSAKKRMKTEFAQQRATVKVPRNLSLNVILMALL